VRASRFIRVDDAMATELAFEVKHISDDPPFQTGDSIVVGPDAGLFQPRETFFHRADRFGRVPLPIGVLSDHSQGRS
jgi:hypothetical protein